MKNLKRLISLLLVVTFCITGVCGCGNANNPNNTTQSIVKNNLSKDGYKLEQVVVLSRHNIRSPLSEKGSVFFEFFVDSAQQSGIVNIVACSEFFCDL